MIAVNLLFTLSSFLFAVMSTFSLNLLASLCVVWDMDMGE